MHPAKFLLVLIVTLAGLAGSTLHGQSPGSLDLSFNGTGQAAASIGPSDDYGNVVLLQGDGRIVLVGQTDNGINFDFAVARFNANGTPDTTFNGTGKASTDFAGDSDIAIAGALQTNGKIVLAGGTNNGSNFDFGVARFNANGTPDTTFNSTGKVATPMGTGISFATAVAVQSDGKIVVAGYAQDGPAFSFAIARYHGDVVTGAPGTLDLTFNGTGKVLLAVGVADSNINAMVLQGDGKIVVAGYSVNTVDFDSVVARFNTNGTLDTTFNGTGKVSTSFTSGDDVFTAVALQSDGKIVAGGYAFNPTNSNSEFTVARYSSAGVLDATFNGTGKVITAIGPSDDSVTGIAVQPDGKVVAAGRWTDVFTPTCAVVRYHSNGSLDTTFNGTGIKTLDLGPGDDVVGGVVLQGDGKIVLGGAAGVPADFTVVRLIGASALDTWRQTWFGTTVNSGPAANDADPYRTGVSNLLVFGLFGPAQNPAAVTTGMRPKPQIVGGNYVVQFTQPAGVSGITYGAQWRPNLASGIWLPVSDSGTGNIHIFSIPIGTNLQAFMRLTATSP